MSGFLTKLSHGSEQWGEEWEILMPSHCKIVGFAWKIAKKEGNYKEDIADNSRGFRRGGYKRSPGERELRACVCVCVCEDVLRRSAVWWLMHTQKLQALCLFLCLFVCVWTEVESEGWHSGWDEKTHMCLIVNTLSLSKGKCSCRDLLWSPRFQLASVLCLSLPLCLFRMVLWKVADDCGIRKQIQHLTLKQSMLDHKKFRSSSTGEDSWNCSRLVLSDNPRKRFRSTDPWVWSSWIFGTNKSIVGLYL